MIKSSDTTTKQNKKMKIKENSDPKILPCFVKIQKPSINVYNYTIEESEMMQEEMTGLKPKSIINNGTLGGKIEKDSEITQGKVLKKSSDTKQNKNVDNKTENDSKEHQDPKIYQCVLKVPRLPNNVLKKFKNDNSNLDFKESQDCIGISQNNTSRKKPEIMQKGKKGLRPNIDELSRNKQPVKKKVTTIRK